jgi:hypothetical protein
MLTLARWGGTRHTCATVSSPWPSLSRCCLATSNPLSFLLVVPAYTSSLRPAGLPPVLDEGALYVASQRPPPWRLCWPCRRASAAGRSACLPVAAVLLAPSLARGVCFSCRFGRSAAPIRVLNGDVLEVWTRRCAPVWSRGGSTPVLPARCRQKMRGS